MRVVVALALCMLAACAGRRSVHPGFYAGYFRDPDGNKLNAFVMG